MCSLGFPSPINTSSLTHLQYIALQVLEKLIQTRWKALPTDQQMGIRNFIVQATVELSSDEQRMRREKGYLNKLNLVLVQVSCLHDRIRQYTHAPDPQASLA